VRDCVSSRAFAKKSRARAAFFEAFTPEVRDVRHREPGGSGPRFSEKIGLGERHYRA